MSDSSGGTVVLGGLTGHWGYPASRDGEDGGHPRTGVAPPRDGLQLRSARRTADRLPAGRTSAPWATPHMHRNPKVRVPLQMFAGRRLTIAVVCLAATLGV